MPKPLATMMGPHDVASRPRDAAQGARRPRSVGPDPLLDEAPRRFNGVVVGRVRRQEPHRGPALLDQALHGRRFVRPQIIEQHDVAPAQAGRQPAPDPVLERRRLHPTPAGPEGDPALRPHRPDQRQVVAPIHRPRFHIFLAALDPGVRAAHRDIHARFIDGNQPPRVDPPDPRAEGLAFGPNVGSVVFTWARPFFFNTYPARFIARRKLVVVVRCARPTRRLYARHSSSLVPSGRSRTTAWTRTRSIGDRHPPPRGRGITESVARYCATQRSSVRYPSPNRAASSWYPPSPASYAATARPRNATSYGFGMASVKYSSCVNSSAFRD